MLDEKNLNRFGPLGFNLGQKEKDYLQHWILTYLSDRGCTAVFKGGTCLQKVFNLPRYSEDLDFTLNDGIIEIEELPVFLSRAGFENPTLKKNETPISENYKVRTRGPLYKGKTISEVSVTIEISKRENLVLKPTPVNIKPIYPDLISYSLLCMDKHEIAAEKIRAIYYRHLPRDLYDLYFLLRQEAVPNIEMINKKLAYYNMQFTESGFEKNIEEIKKSWAREIASLSCQPLDFETAFAEVKKAIETV